MRRQALPAAGAHEPHVQEPEQVSTPQGSPLAHARVAPGAHAPPPEQALQLPHAPQSQLVASQLRVRVRVPVPQLPHGPFSVSVMPGVQVPAPPPEHVPHPLHAPQLQAAEQVRVRDCLPVPHVPHAWVSDSVAPIAQRPSSVHDHGPQVQSSRQTRACVPQLPHVPPISTSPIEHGPPPTQVPSSTHTPPVHT